MLPKQPLATYVSLLHVPVSGLDVTSYKPILQVIILMIAMLVFSSPGTVWEIQKENMFWHAASYAGRTT